MPFVEEQRAKQLETWGRILVLGTDQQKREPDMNRDFEKKDKLGETQVAVWAGKTGWKLEEPPVQNQIVLPNNPNNPYPLQNFAEKEVLRQDQETETNCMVPHSP